MILNIRQERINHGWKLNYVAQQVGVTKAALHNIETGQRYPSFKVLVKLLDLFGYSDPRQLFAEADGTSNLTETE